MKIKKNFILRNIASNNIVLPTNENDNELNGIISLNDLGAFIWKNLYSETTEEELLNKIIAEYEVTEEIAKEDLQNFLKQLKEANLLE